MRQKNGLEGLDSDGKTHSIKEIRVALPVTGRFLGKWWGFSTWLASSHVYSSLRHSNQANAKQECNTSDVAFKNNKTLNTCVKNKQNDH